MNGMNIGKSWDDAACTSCPIMIPHGKKADTETTRSLPRSKRSLGLQRPQQKPNGSWIQAFIGRGRVCTCARAHWEWFLAFLNYNNIDMIRTCVYIIYTLDIIYIYNIMFKIRVVRLHIYIYTHIVVWTHSPPPYKSCGSMAWRRETTQKRCQFPPARSIYYIHDSCLECFT